MTLYVFLSCCARFLEHRVFLWRYARNSYTHLVVVSWSSATQLELVTTALPPVVASPLITDVHHRGPSVRPSVRVSTSVTAHNSCDGCLLGTALAAIRTDTSLGRARRLVMHASLSPPSWPPPPPFIGDFHFFRSALVDSH